MAREIAGMSVVVTGASAGIGAAVARELDQRGAMLTLSARRGDRLDALNRELGGGHLVVVGDVSREEDCAGLVAAAFARWGRVDVLVCNAGYGELRGVVDMPAERVRAMFATNVLGTTECIRAAVPGMLKQELRGGYRGQVMIVSSAAARRGLPMGGTYSATKASQLSIAEALRVELRGTGIGVTTVHPVGTRTEFFEVAEKLGETTVRARAPGGFTQSAEHVARRMVRAMERPVPEVWPLRVSRYVLSLATLMPRLGDWMMSRARSSK